MQLKSYKPRGIAKSLKWVVYHSGCSARRWGNVVALEDHAHLESWPFRTRCRRGAIVRHAVSVVSSSVDLSDPYDLRIALLDSMPAGCHMLPDSAAEPTFILLSPVAPCHHSEALAGS
jgi:hypothetical protein